jgi:hypothetical protein
MATVIKEPTSEPPFEVPGPSYYDERDMLGVRLGVPFRLHFLATFGLPTQLGTIWLGAWGVASVAFFVAGLAVLFASGIASMNGNVLEYVRHFANVQELPPDGLGMARSLSAGGYWQINMLLWAAAVVCWLDAAGSGCCATAGGRTCSARGSRRFC